MTTTFTIANTTINASRTISITDAETTRLAAALNATRYLGQNLTPAQAVTTYFRELIGDAASLVYGYEASLNQPTPIAPTG